MTDDDSLLTACKVASASGVPQLTIRRWSRDGLLTFRCDSAGRRLYGPKAIEEAKALRARATWKLDGSPMPSGKDRARRKHS